MASHKTIVVVGAGAFGLSTALALADRYPEARIRVFDRHEPPVLDGSSTDTTRCIRYDYSKSPYAQLAKESLGKIAQDPELSPLFHQVGMTFVYDGQESVWAENWRSQLETVRNLTDNDQINILPTRNHVYKSIHHEDPGHHDAPQWNMGYTNYASGYIEADNAIEVYYQKCLRKPQITFTFTPVESIVYSHQNPGPPTAVGVKLESGQTIDCDLVIVAAGSWSCRLVNLEKVSKSSCIAVVWYDAEPDEIRKWKSMPITTNFTTGINLFPPLRGEIKVLRRSPGFTNTVSVTDPSPDSNQTISISYPRTAVTNPGDWIPKAEEDEIRSNMREIMPSLADRPFKRTKYCWITQTTTANFLIDFLPNTHGVLLATGGSAHGWKFLPVLGDKVVDLLDGRLDPTLKSMWSWDEKLSGTYGSSNASRLEGSQIELHTVVRSHSSV